MNNTVQGVMDLAATIAKQEAVTMKGLRKGLYRAGLFLQRESQKIVPVDTTVLRESATTIMEGSGMDVAAVVSYATDYAVYVHENLEVKHKPGKQAKFLETPLREQRDRLQEIIVDAIQEEA